MTTSVAESAQTARLCNSLGNGQAPKLSLKLLANGPKWNTFNINYGAMGNIPLPNPYNASQDWSTWGVYDEQNNYYGSFDLARQTSASAYTLSNYQGEAGYYLEGVTFKSSENQYTISADSIHQPAPFPNVPRSTPACYKDTNVPIKLGVSGNQILANGRSITLQGFVRPSLEWSQTGQYLSEQDINNIRATGANVIRLDLNAELWNQSGDVSEIGSYKQTVDAIIELATQNGMAVILDLHWMDALRKQTPMPDKNGATQFWSDIASRYKDHGTVMFELFNEPNGDGVTPDVWLNGNDQYAGMSEMLKAVRDTGATNPVILNGLAFGYDHIHLQEQWEALAGEPNLILGIHAYNDQGSENYDPDNGGSFQNNLAPYLQNRPALSTEFGCNQAQAYSDGSWQAVYQRMLDFYLENNIHSTGFAWWIDVPSFPSMISGDWTAPVLQNGGKLFKQALLGNATDFFNWPAPETRSTDAIAGACDSTAALLAAQTYEPPKEYNSTAALLAAQTYKRPQENRPSSAAAIPPLLARQNPRGLGRVLASLFPACCLPSREISQPPAAQPTHTTR